MDRDRLFAVRPFLALAVALLLAGCSFFEATPTMRGNKVEAEQLNELVPGTSTRSDVTALIGSPTTKATFDDNTWIYVSEVTRPRVGRTPGVLDQNVVVLSFDDQGVLRDVKKLNQEDFDTGHDRGPFDALAGDRGVVPAAAVRQYRPLQRLRTEPGRAVRRRADAGLLSRRRRQPGTRRPVPDDQRRGDDGRRQHHKVQRLPAAGRLDRT